MQRKTLLILALLPASVLASASSCTSKIKPQVALHVPADTFDRADRPQMTAEALDSAEAGEMVQDARDAWAKAVARQLDAACRLMRDSGVKGLKPCRPAVAEWE
jgi:hypothetical protein